MKSQTPLIRIGELAQRSGKTARALHLYEEKGLLSPAERSKGGFRLYNDNNIARIEYIDRLQRLGYRLADIQGLLTDWNESDSPRAAMDTLGQAYKARLTEVRKQIAELSTLEAELEESLAYIDGCGGCQNDATPVNACGCCGRSNETITLVHGIAGG